ncbi:MAG: SPOR domain-containing protein [Bacteroidetes bacterium]|nr:SPOR domain-containing protein [Bacteroidota bacterium]
MRKVIFIPVILFIVSGCLVAQEPDVPASAGIKEKEPEKDFFEVLQEKTGNAGEVTVFQDADLRQLVNRHIELNEKVDAIPGWRIEFFSESGYGSREAAMKARKEFEVKYPDIGAYESYDGINFKVRVGDFRTKSEAMKVKYRIAGDYPQTFIVKEMIRFPEPEYSSGE